MNKLLQLLYLAQWFLGSRLLGRKKPLQSVVFVTGGCDSTCRHCTACRVDKGHFKKFDDIARDFRLCYERGARILDVEGVDIVRWKDGDRRPGDVFALARSIGFYNISTMVPAKDWNEWSGIKADVDVLWISIMGLEDMQYLNDQQDASLYMVVNSANCNEIHEILEFMREHRNFKQIAFNFHTPFAGTEDLALSPSQREGIIRELIAHKKKGYRIMNTVSGLKNMLSLEFKRYCWICNFVYCDGRTSPVCIDDESTGMCAKCGFCMSGEMNAVFRFKPDTILTGLTSRG